MMFSSEIIIGYDNKRADSFDEYGRKPWQDDYNDQERFEYEWETFHAFQGEYARLFGPKRRGVSNEFGSIERSMDSDDFHASRLKMEQRCKENIKRWKRKK